MPVRRSLAALAAAALLAAIPSGVIHAQESASLVLELNDVQRSERGCRLTFLVVNGLGVELTEAAFEVALFNARGAVDRLRAEARREREPRRVAVDPDHAAAVRAQQLDGEQPDQPEPVHDHRLA